LAVAAEAAEKLESTHGTKYVLEGIMTTPGGGAPRVRTIWIIDRGRNCPRLVTAYPAESRERIMTKEHDRVVLTAPLPENGLKPGDVGTVVHLYGDGLAYEVEFVALDGHTAAVVTVEASRVRPISRGEITHARSLEVD
jgi:hypothetical protein